MRTTWPTSILIFGLATLPIRTAHSQERLDQAQVIAALKKIPSDYNSQPATFEFDESRPGKPLIGVNLAPTVVTDKDLRLLKDAKELQSLGLLFT